MHLKQTLPGLLQSMMSSNASVLVLLKCLMERVKDNCVKDESFVSSRSSRSIPGARYGTDLFYSSFSKNKHTTWYVFYSVHIIEGETIYLVRHLTNNHVIAQHLDFDA